MSLVAASLPFVTTPVSSPADGQVADACRDEVAGSTVVQVCDPAGATDPRILWVLLVVVLLLLPDVSELELAGVLSLKRAVAQVGGQAQQLSGEVQRVSAALSAVTQQFAVQITAQGQGQGQTQQLVVQMPPAAQVENFFNDIESNDVSTLTAEEEVGGYASLAFASAMSGMLAELFGPWAHRANLVGWVGQPDGTFDSTYIVQVVAVAEADEVAETLLLQWGAELSPFINDFPGGGFALTAVVPALYGSRWGRPLGALSIFVESPHPGVSDELEALAANTVAAAGAYGVLLQRVLGEPSTLEASPSKEQR